MNVKRNVKMFSLASLILIASSFSYETNAAQMEQDDTVKFGLIGDKSENKVPVRIPEAVDIGVPSTFSGEVALTNIPKLAFDPQKIQGHKIEVDAKDTGQKVPGIRVDDVSGEGSGWTLRVRGSKFVRTDDNTTELMGAQLEYPKVAPVTYKNSQTKDNAPVVNKTMLSFDESVKTLMSAGKGAGMGAWEVAYQGDQGIKLVLPPGQLLGTYQATVTYELTVGDIAKNSAE